jgi:hypothetical protein
MCMYTYSNEYKRQFKNDIVIMPGSLTTFNKSCQGFSASVEPCCNIVALIKVMIKSCLSEKLVQLLLYK